MRLLRLTSLASMTRRIDSIAASAEVPIATSPVTTATSASKSMPQSSLRGDDVVARAEEVVAAALVHQRVGPEARRHLGVARPADQLDVVDEGRAVGPLVGARQRRHAARRLEGERVARLAVVERGRQVLELRRQEVPVVEDLLQARRDRAGIVGGREVARDDDELAVARAVLVGGELHRACSGARGAWPDEDRLSMLDRSAAESPDRRPPRLPRRASAPRRRALVACAVAGARAACASSSAASAALAPARAGAARRRRCRCGRCRPSRRGRRAAGAGRRGVAAAATPPSPALRSRAPPRRPREPSTSASQPAVGVRAKAGADSSEPRRCRRAGARGVATDARRPRRSLAPDRIARRSAADVGRAPKPGAAAGADRALLAAGEQPPPLYRTQLPPSVDPALSSAPRLPARHRRDPLAGRAATAIASSSRRASPG